jgi:hypothetical protein
VFAYNAARAHGAEWLALALSVGLPLFMSTWLWASRNRAQLYAEQLPASHATPVFSPFAAPEPSSAPRARRAALINDLPKTG